MCKWVYRPLGLVVKGESGVQSHSDLDCMSSIPAIPNARYVPSLLCRELFNEASLLVNGCVVRAAERFWGSSCKLPG